MKAFAVIEPFPCCARGGGDGGVGDGVEGSEAADDVGGVAVLVVGGQVGFCECCLTRG